MTLENYRRSGAQLALRPDHAYNLAAKPSRMATAPLVLGRDNVLEQTDAAVAIEFAAAACQDAAALYWRKTIRIARPRSRLDEHEDVH